MKYSQKYKEELDEAVKEKRRLDKEYKDFKEKFLPLQQENQKRMMDIIGLDIKIKELRHNYHQALFEENTDEDGMIIEGINVWN